MAKRSHTSIYPESMTNNRLIELLREYANMEGFEPNTIRALDNPRGITGNEIRKASKLYRRSWLDPIIREIENRLCKKLSARERRAVYDAGRLAYSHNKFAGNPYSHKSESPIERLKSAAWLEGFNYQKDMDV